VTATPIRLVLFDLDDVLYDYDRAWRIRHLAVATGLAEAAIERAIWTDGVEDAADAGAFADVPAYLAAWSAALGVNVDLDLWTEARRVAMMPIEGSLALARRLADAGTTVAILTNNGPAVHAMRERLVPEAAALAGGRFLVSSAFGTRKPDPAIYLRALDRLGFSPDETLFVDDRADNVAGARDAGLDGHRFVGPDGLAAALAARGLPQPRADRPRSHRA